MIDLKKFMESAISNGLCEGYTDMWMNKKDKKSLFDLACDANGVSYMAESYSQGWGLSTDFIAENFKQYINGRYIAEYKNGKGNGYTSAMLCLYKDKSFEVTTTLLCVLDSRTELKIAKNNICEIHIAGDCKIKVTMGAGSMVHIYAYGEEPTVDYPTTLENPYLCTFERILKEEDE